jgi:hypothetical protein
MSGLAANTHGVTGWYSNVTPSAFISSELTIFNRMSASHVENMRRGWCVIWSQASEFNVACAMPQLVAAEDNVAGLTFPGPGGRGVSYVNYTERVTGVTTHEWHHGIDFAYGTPWGTTFGRSVQADWQEIWTRAQTFWPLCPTPELPAATYYGWTNAQEFFAELGRTYWAGSADGSLTPVSPYVGNNNPDTDPDTTFRSLVSGYGTTTDDSYIVQVRSIMANLNPPPPPFYA